MSQPADTTVTVAAATAINWNYGPPSLANLCTRRQFSSVAPSVAMSPGSFPRPSHALATMGIREEATGNHAAIDNDSTGQFPSLIVIGTPAFIVITLTSYGQDG